MSDNMKYWLVMAPVCAALAFACEYVKPQLMSVVAAIVVACSFILVFSLARAAALALKTYLAPSPQTQPLKHSDV